ncbi:Otubain [Corchorus olitorius]|uniref:Otubain n=1 Tax=Corchorus olitorius TaxID=93759 RepID=A0A1R3FX90_9ROSI|nr:Otubain [Corchorus olitorius]
MSLDQTPRHPSEFIGNHLTVAPPQSTLPELHLQPKKSRYVLFVIPVPVPTTVLQAKAHNPTNQSLTEPKSLLSDQAKPTVGSP